MLRFAHELRPLVSKQSPNYFYFFDTETKTTFKDENYEIQHLHLGWCCRMRLRYDRENNTETWKYFETAKDFWGFVQETLPANASVWIIAHNISFDWTIVKGFEFAAKLKWQRIFAYFGGRTTIIRYRHQKTHIYILDTLNWYPYKLAELGERLGKPKIECDPLTAKKEDVSSYCKRDVEILKDVLLDHLKFIRDNDLGPVGYTLAAQALKTYRYKSYKGGIFIHDDLILLKFERESYKGGRCECFHIGKVRSDLIYYLDINAMYPYVMKNYKIPTARIAYFRHGNLRGMRKWLKTHAIIARVEVDLKEPLIAVRQDKLEFDIGTFETCVTTPEIEILLEKGAIKNVREYAVYTQSKIFADYIDFIYKLRLQFKCSKDPIREQFIKGLANSLYGKFGQKCECWETIGKCGAEQMGIERVFDIDDNRWITYRYLGGDIETKIGEVEPLTSCPAIASHITAFARCLLTKYILQAGYKNCYYCDTDSLFVNANGYHNLSNFLDDNKLGFLKVEAIAKSLIINGPKDYVLDGKVKLKGISPTAIKIDDNTYRQQHWPKLKSIIRNGQSGYYRIEQRTKILNRIYTKGVVDNEGNVTPKKLEFDFEDVAEA